MAYKHHCNNKITVSPMGITKNKHPLKTFLNRLDASFLTRTEFLYKCMLNCIDLNANIYFIMVLQTI